ncbi:hypothetical protein AV530_013705 [Patagioenas fasciata monilis]|uniref:Uncharacterized protein n=1 Tax=Patagioenas fasciata monilis TaxID=372326 RepID=A0A1V4J7W0_PATFA|nr:hypothetical protein AV530_013705 [Patagioenas fasciata monilis]
MGESRSEARQGAEGRRKEPAPEQAGDPSSLVMAWTGHLASGWVTYSSVLSPASVPPVPRHDADAEPLLATQPWPEILGSS